MEKLAESTAVPEKNDTSAQKKVRDVVASPSPDATTAEKAKTAIEEASKQAQKTEAAKPEPAKVEVVKADPIKVAPPKPHFVGLQGKAKLVPLATLKNEDDGSGDRLSLTRRFQAWSLICDIQVTKGDKICVIQQALRPGEADAFTWRLATSAAGKPIVMFDFTDLAEADKGLNINIAGFDKNIPATEWSCSQGRCSATMPIVGPVSSWFTSTSQIQFRYDRGSEAIRLTAGMTGFESAVQALQNPLGLRSSSVEPVTSSLKSNKTAQAN